MSSANGTSMNFGPEWMRRLTKTTQGNEPTKNSSQSGNGHSSFVGNPLISPPSQPAFSYSSIAANNHVKDDSVSTGLNGQCQGVDDQLNPFKYSREFMLSLYTPSVVLPLEFERHEYVTSEDTLEPAANLPLSELEKKVLSGPINSEVPRRGPGGERATNSPRNERFPSNLGSPRAERFDRNERRRRSDRDEFDSRRGYNKSTRNVSSGYYGSIEESTWNGVSKDAVGSFDANGVFRITGADQKGIEEEELEPQNSRIEKNLDENLEFVNRDEFADKNIKSKRHSDEISAPVTIPKLETQDDNTLIQDVKVSWSLEEDDPKSLVRGALRTESPGLDSRIVGKLAPAPSSLTQLDPTSADALWSHNPLLPQKTMSPAQFSSDPLSSRKLSSDSIPSSLIQPSGSGPRSVSPSIFSQSSSGFPSAKSSHIAPASSSRLISPADAKWFYRDPSNKIQGPFSGLEMDGWYKNRFFSPDLPVRRDIDPSFEPLDLLIQRLGNDRDPFLVPYQAIMPEVRRPSVNSLSSIATQWGGLGNTSNPVQQPGSALSAQFVDINLSPFTPGFNSPFSSVNKDPLASPWDQRSSLQLQPPQDLFGGFDIHTREPEREIFERQREQQRVALMVRTRELETAKDLQQHQQQNEIAATAGYTTNDVDMLNLMMRHRQQREELVHLEAQLQQAKLQFLQQYSPPIQQEQPLQQQSQNHQPQSVGPMQPISTQTLFGQSPGIEFERSMAPLRPLQQQVQQPQSQSQSWQAMQENIVQSSMPNISSNSAWPSILQNVGPMLSGPRIDQSVMRSNVDIEKDLDAAAEALSKSDITDELGKEVIASPVKESSYRAGKDVDSESIETDEAKTDDIKVKVENEGLSSSIVDTNTSGPETPSAPVSVAPWAKSEQVNIPKGPTLREIQEIEAKNAEARKEKQKKILATSGSITVDNNSATSAIFATGPWSAAAVAKPSTKKTLLEIQEEEARQARLEREKQAQQRQQSANVSTMNTRYADLIGGNSTARRVANPGLVPQTTSATVTSGGTGWVTVGAGGKASALPLSNVKSTAVNGSSATGPVRFVNTRPIPKPSNVVVSTPAKALTPSCSGPSDEFLRWCKTALRGINGVNVDEFVGMLISLTNDAITSETQEIISDMIYANHSTLNGRQFAEEFIKKRKSDQSIVRKNGGDNGSDFASVLKQPVKNPDSEWNGAFKVVDNKKKHKKKSQPQNHIPGGI